jgi:prepilin-type N-terminal cleavage/methylation domain-containing protein
MPGRVRSAARPPRSAAFSLLEMLVVVAVIAVLAVLSLAMVKKVRDKAAIAGSMHNLRQIGIAVAAYVGENNGLLPEKTYPKWLDATHRILYDEKWPGFQPWETGANMRGTAYYSPMLKASEPQPWRSYGWNNRLNYNSEVPPHRLHEIPNPSRAILCGDSHNSSAIEPDQVNYRNNGKALILMADFTVRLFSPEEIPKSNIDPMWRPFPK